ncbi:hypothetical protein L596_003690 [Steinernema carpocapsae]|uniref:Uncharacterized protein n=1 Tax=Steinernema carpocapsae TaxID=34508 RepID=A0A4U8UTH4_STECR|nr:hypothetical protein L596_003690 [Steinernema carpocapsae]
MNREKKIDVARSNYSVIDNEFDNMRDRFESEMRRVEEEMQRLRREFEGATATLGIQALRIPDNPASNRRVPTTVNSTRTNDLSTARLTVPTLWPRDPFTTPTWTT